jgi:FkbM family methyltransferase
MARETTKKAKAKPNGSKRASSTPKPPREASPPPKPAPAGQMAMLPLDPPPKTGSRLLTNRHMALKRCRHGWFMYNVNDEFVGRSLDLYGEWCESELVVLTPLLQPGRVVLDVGAFIGTHTVYFADKVGSNGRVYAIEPQRHAFQTLCGNVALNGLTNVLCLPCIAGNESGQRPLQMASATIKQNFGATRALIAATGEPTQVIRIDDLKLPRCDLIKIDVEGMEADVLAGARATIERFKPVIYCENNKTERSGEVISAFHALGYKAWWHIAGYFNSDNYFGDQENVFARYVPEANMICLHSSSKIVIEDLLPVSGPDDNWRKALGRMMSQQRSA